ncbi:transposase [Streptomyces sp. NBC_00096]
MVRRHELTNAQWDRIAPLLSETGGPGGRWADHRTVVDGVLYRTRTGIPWRYLSERHGSWQTVYERQRRWSADGAWSKILRARSTCWPMTAAGPWSG